MRRVQNPITHPSSRRYPSTGPSLLRRLRARLFYGPLNPAQFRRLIRKRREAKRLEIAENAMKTDQLNNSALTHGPIESMTLEQFRTSNQSFYLPETAVQ